MSSRLSAMAREEAQRDAERVRYQLRGAYQFHQTEPVAQTLDLAVAAEMIRKARPLQVRGSIGAGVLAAAYLDIALDLVTRHMGDGPGPFRIVQMEAPCPAPES